MKNAGTVVAKVIANLSIAALCYWAIGFALAFGGAGWFAGTEGPSSATAQARSRRWSSPARRCPPSSSSSSPSPLSLAIVWGTTLERIKFGAYLIYAVVFASLIYPVINRWIFGGGWLKSELRDAGLRRLDGDPPDRRHRGARRPTAARPRAGKYGRTAART